MKGVILTLVLLLPIVSCKKKDNDGPANNNSTTATVTKIDTVALLKGCEWYQAYVGTDSNRNGILDAGELGYHFTISFYVLNFKDNGYMTDSSYAGNPPSSHAGIDGYWQFVGTNKSVILYSVDSMSQTYGIIRGITDSTLNLLDSFNHWWIFEKYKR